MSSDVLGLCIETNKESKVSKHTHEGKSAAVLSYSKGHERLWGIEVIAQHICNSAPHTRVCVCGSS
jgi:hypothetical protein